MLTFTPERNSQGLAYASTLRYYTRYNRFRVHATRLSLPLQFSSTKSPSYSHQQQQRDHFAEENFIHSQCRPLVIDGSEALNLRPLNDHRNVLQMPSLAVPQILLLPSYRMKRLHLKEI